MQKPDQWWAAGAVLLAFVLAPSLASSQTVGRVPLAAKLILTQTAAASATLDFVLPGGSNTYLLDCNGLLPADNVANLLLRYGQGAGPTYLNSGYSNTISIQLSSGAGVTTVEEAGTGGGVLLALAAWNSLPNSVSTKVWFSAGPDAGTRYADFTSATRHGGSAAFQSFRGMGGYGVDATAITALRVMFSSGAITSGQCSLYAMVP